MYQHAELAHWLQNRDTMKILPAQVDIDLTNICNQDCFYCNSADFRNAAPVQLNYRKYIKLLDQIAAWRSHSPNSYGTTHTITYPGGGEPTLLKNYERVIEHTVDLGFLTSLTTNGYGLDKLIQNVGRDKIRKMAWIGVDIDSADQDEYELIRRSTSKRSIFPKVMKNIKDLVNTGANVDLKVLLNEHNARAHSITRLFQHAHDLGVRMLYFRPVILNGQAFEIYDGTVELMDLLSERMGVKYQLNTNKTLPRNYNRCHQMFQFPVCCADGNVYVCCDNKGNPEFSIGSWLDDDIRDIWLSDRHWEVYNKINTNFCQPCRPNPSNIKIQDILDNPKSIETLYL